ncbi:hypothetical protein BG015_002832 [Linnemannia schmuckeri]|uniref:PQ-loop-domain-containing protein n=1 Tax=Linnemannia schmuckeri TaxID=64567 RepID=A0A9P5VD11_9FUNG|nr:hypothetical protein BG015_002832 [Linnemannia schmuckeri]
MVAHTVLYWLASQGAVSSSTASTVAATVAEEAAVPLKIYLSNIAGSLSILCWFIVFTPQFWINYKRQSGESLSLVFLYIWLAGDIMNLIGATMENLLLTMRILAWYYTIADIALIAQIFYYRKNSVKASFESVITHANPEAINAPHGAAAHGEHAPLVAGSTTHNYSSIAPSEHVHENEHDRVIHKAAMVANATAAAGHYNDDHHHHHHHSSHHPVASGLPTTAEYLGQRQRRPSSHSALTSGSGRYRSKKAKRHQMIRCTVMIVFPIVLASFFIWAYFDWLQCTIGHGEDTEEGSRCGRGNGGGHGKLPPSPKPPSSDDDSILSVLSSGDKEGEGEDKGFIHVWMPLILGWGSAILYLGSRIPQIYKNWRLKSCEGLSIMMFMFSVFGNVFYVASIFLNSLEIDYLIKNMPWWLGSGGTLVFDFTIFFQFYIYRNNNPLAEALKEAAESGELDQNALNATAEDDETSSSSCSSDEEDTTSTTDTLIPQHKKSKSQQHPTSASSNV